MLCPMSSVSLLLGKKRSNHSTQLRRLLGVGPFLTYCPELGSPLPLRIGHEAHSDCPPAWVRQPARHRQGPGGLASPAGHLVDLGLAQSGRAPGIVTSHTSPGPEQTPGTFDCWSCTWNLPRSSQLQPLRALSLTALNTVTGASIDLGEYLSVSFHTPFSSLSTAPLLLRDVDIPVPKSPAKLR